MYHRFTGRTLRTLLSLAVAIAAWTAFTAPSAKAEPSDLTESAVPAQKPAKEAPKPDVKPEPNSNIDNDAERDADHSQEPADRKHPHMHKHSMHLITDAATIIGIDPEALKKELKAGKSIAEVAQAKGIKEADLTSKLFEAKVRKIDEAVKSGKWTSEKADRVKERLPDQLKYMIHHKGFHMKREGEKQ